MDLHSKQFARVNVKTILNGCAEEVLNRSFSVDPRTITLDKLYHLLARALHIREEFSMMFLRSKNKECVLLSCDWDLEGALAEETTVDLVLEMKPKEPGLEDWDIICTADVPVAGHETSRYPRQRKGSFLDQILQFRMPYPRSYSFLSSSDFEALEDWPCPLRYATFRAGGAEPSIRPSLWMHLLDVYPSGAGPKDRVEFLNRKAEEYYGLRHSWQKLVQAGTISNVLRDVITLVRKDVRRTDRAQNLDDRALYNILTTYAVHHPTVGYCQGMSDLLSPLFHVMGTEALAYIALCGLMQRMRDNFRHDGRSINTKFRHLRRALRSHDPALHEHLSSVGALDLLFCYRWLLLDLKREFCYNEMLRLTEVHWATLPPLHLEKGVNLYEKPFPIHTLQDTNREKIEQKDCLTFTENHFGTPKRSATCLSLKRWALLSRRQSIARNIESDVESSSTDEDEERSIIHYKRRRRPRNLCRSWSGRDSIDSQRGLCYSNTVHDIQVNNWLNNVQISSDPRRRHGSSDSNYGSTLSEEEPSEDDVPSRSRSEGYTSGQDSQQALTDQSHSDIDQDFGSSSLNSFDSAETYFNERNHGKPLLLPLPTRLGDGKPFLIFLCLTMVLNHRNAILDNNMDANEIGIYFDRLVRKHRLFEVLPMAKEMFLEYLSTGWTEDD